MRPYVVSADIRLLLAEWAGERWFALPGEDFFQSLRQEFAVYLEKIFPEFELVPEDELVTGVARFVRQSGLFPLSLDKVYYRSQPSLEISRLVDESGTPRGLGRRGGSSSLLSQFKTIEAMGVKEIVLVDDVVWTGDLLGRVIAVLSRVGIGVPVICSGIEIEEVDTGNGQRGSRWLQATTGTEVRSVRSYREVVDQICERDFYPGVPLSGRTLVGDENVGMPYVLPFGKPGDWASIPEEWELPFSKFCIRQTVKLFEEIEHFSGRVVRCRDLERRIISLPRDDTRFVDALQKSLLQK